MTKEKEDNHLGFKSFIETIFLISGAAVGVVVFSFSNFVTKAEMNEKLNAKKDLSDQQFMAINEQLKEIKTDVKEIRKKYP